MYEIGEKTETILSSLQACFVITHSEDFIVKNIHNDHLYNLQTCIKAWQKISMLSSIVMQECFVSVVA